MKTKWCYACDKEKLVREFYGPAEHKNSVCDKCYDKATEQEYRNLGFELED